MIGTTRADIALASVLVVDDAAAVRHAARAMLEFYGYEVFTAESGAAAILELEELQGNVGLIMLDYRLPDMKAAEVVVALRLRYPAVKIVLVSSYAHEEIDASLADLPFVQKPLRFSDIGDIVASFVYAEQQPRQTITPLNYAQGNLHHDQGNIGETQPVAPPLHNTVSRPELSIFMRSKSPVLKQIVQ